MYLLESNNAIYLYQYDGLIIPKPLTVLDHVLIIRFIVIICYSLFIECKYSLSFLIKKCFFFENFIQITQIKLPN